MYNMWDTQQMTSDIMCRNNDGMFINACPFYFSAFLSHAWLRVCAYVRSQVCLYVSVRAHASVCAICSRQKHI